MMLRFGSARAGRVWAVGRCHACCLLRLTVVCTAGGSVCAKSLVRCAKALVKKKADQTLSTDPLSLVPDGIVGYKA